MFHYHSNFGYNLTKSKKIDIQDFLDLRIACEGSVVLFQVGVSAKFIYLEAEDPLSGPLS